MDPVYSQLELGIEIKECGHVCHGTSGYYQHVRRNHEREKWDALGVKPIQHVVKEEEGFRFLQSIVTGKLL